MDPTGDDIDPSWWEDALRASSGGGAYQPPEILSFELRKAAELAENPIQKSVLGVLALVSSATLDPENWTEPFAPMWTRGNERPALPSDLSGDQLALLDRLAPLIQRHDLRARVADVAWTYGDRSNSEMRDRAIDAYSSAPLDADSWFNGGRDAWIRAFELLGRSGQASRPRVQEMSSALSSQILACTVDDKFRAVQLAEVLRRHGRDEPSVRVQVRDALVALATESVTSNFRLSRHLEREAIFWLDTADTDSRNAASARIGETYIAEADSRLEESPAGGALVEGHCLEKAVAVLRTIPRSYRVKNGIDERIDVLRVRLRDSRESSLEQMARFQSDPVDLTECISSARSRVSGHLERSEALVLFATLIPPIDADKTREDAEKLLRGSLAGLFGSSTISSDFRKVAERPASSGEVDEAAIWAAMASTVVLHSEIIAKGMIRPAQEVLTTGHHFSQQYLVSICQESPLVPEGHALLWATGLSLGLSDNYGAAIAVLIPQLEQAVRVQLKLRDVFTLYVDEQGVEREKGLNALLDMTETSDIFGTGMVLEMRALLVDQAGPNLRNDLAHGILFDGAAWSYTALFVWWFCLRLAIFPLARMGGQVENPDEAVASEDATDLPD